MRHDKAVKWASYRWNGEAFVPVLLKGPRNFTDWLKSWRIFESLCIMKKVANLATLRKVETRISDLNALFGHDHWGYILEAYDNGSKETLERHLRQAEDDLARNRIDTSEFNPDMPWDYVLSKFADDEKWWNDEVVHKVLFQRQQKTFTAHDAGAGGGTASDTPRRKSKREGDPPPAPKPKAKTAPAPVKKEAMDQQIAREYGIHTHMPDGKRICGWGFKAGACKEPCRRDNVHACHFCLEVGKHRTIDCPQKPAGWTPPPLPKRQ